MITIYTTCRSFEHPHFAMIQKNAIRSWLQLQPTPQILVMGNDPGTKEFCQGHDVEHIDYVQTSPSGVPLMNSMYEIAEKKSKYNSLLLITSDTILFDDTIEAAKILDNNLGTYLGGVVRREINYNHEIDFTYPWKDHLKKHMYPGNFTCGDYYLSSRGFFKEYPPFVIGRSFCDFWLNDYGMRSGCFVDLTEFVTSIHQNHDHSHVGGIEGLENSEDHKCNAKLVGNKGELVTHTPLYMTTNGDIKIRDVIRTEPIWITLPS